MKKESNHDTQIFYLPSAWLARIGVTASLLLISVGALFGRNLEKQYRELIGLVPYVSLFALIGFLLLLVRLNRKRASNRKINIQKKKLFEILLLTIILTLIVGISCESLIILPIERIHLVKYGGLSFCLFFSQTKHGTQRKLLVAFLSASFLGIIEESSQHFIPDRFFDLRDIALNVSAAFFGIAFAWLMLEWNRLLCSK